MLMLLRHAFCLILLCLIPTSLLAARSLFVGVLEPWNERFVGEKSTTTYMARAAFVKSVGQWSPLSASNDIDYPERLTWTVVYSGQIGETFKSRRLVRWVGGDSGLYQPDPHDSVKLIHDQREHFDYWWGKPAFRPVALLSEPRVGDPDKWTPWTPTPDDLKPFYAKFREKAGPVAFDCAGPAKKDYPNSAIIADGAYVSAKGDWFIGLRLDPTLLTCKDMSPDNWVSQWFQVTKRRAKFVGTSLVLIDIGDYDADGWSELLFKKSGYNYDGYVLFHDGLTKQIEFGWSYH